MDINEDEDYIEEEIKIKEKKHKIINNENLLNKKKRRANSNSDIKPVII